MIHERDIMESGKADMLDFPVGIGTTQRNECQPIENQKPARSTLRAAKFTNSECKDKFFN